jgi:hypothetical protein
MTIKTSLFKTCFKCGSVKSLDDFYVHSAMTDGHLGKCKECTKHDVALRIAQKKNDPHWIIKERARSRTKAARYASNGKIWPTKSPKKTYPERKRLYAKVHWAITKGLLTRQPCFCGAVGHAHHHDYTKPYDVTWLCPKHHGAWHVKERERELLGT